MFGLIRNFADGLEGLGIDVARVNGLSTAYSFHIGERAVIALGTSGNWFHANWSLAHEAAHHCLGHAGVMPDAPGFKDREAEANGFAAELLLPEQVIRSMGWASISRGSRRAGLDVGRLCGFPPQETRGAGCGDLLGYRLRAGAEDVGAPPTQLDGGSAG